MSKSIVCTVTNDISQDARMHRICGTLAKNGFQVTLIGRLKPTSIPLEKSNFNTERLTVASERGVLFYLNYNLKLFFYLIKSDADVICSVDADTLLAGRLATWFSNKELVYDAHELFTELPELDNKPVRKLVWKIINRVGLWGSVRCYTVNDELATMLSKKYKHSFISIQNVPDLNQDKRSTLTPTKPIKLVYVGMINKGRGIEESIKFVKNHKNYELHIIGNGDLYDSLKHSTIGQSRIYWYGFLSQNNIKQLLPTFDIGLNLLSANSKNYFYSSANKFFDYVQATVPVLTMNFPVYSRLCSEYKVGELIQSLQESDIEDGIMQILKDYENYGIQCRKARQIWNWQNEEKKLLSFYSVI